MNVGSKAPDIHYAKSGGLNIAFSVTGVGPDLVVAPGFISHLDIMWEEPSVVHFYSRLASFRRVVAFDKRGAGLSDPVMHAPTLEESVDDLRAVMDAAGCESADLVGISEGGTMAMLMTASHPDRVKALVLYGTFSRLLRAPDYPLGVTEEQLSALVEASAKGWGEGVGLGAWAPSRRGDADLRRWWARLQRVAASPGMVRNIFALYPQLDIRDVLPAIRVPTLVLHRRDDRMASLEMGRYVADRIPGAKFVELDGADQLFAQAVLDAGGQLEVIIPAARYRDGLPEAAHAAYDALLSRGIQRAPPRPDRVRRERAHGGQQGHAGPGRASVCRLGR